MWPSKVLFKTQHISFGVRSAHQKFQLRVRQCKQFVCKRDGRELHNWTRFASLRKRTEETRFDPTCNMHKKQRKMLLFLEVQISLFFFFALAKSRFCLLLSFLARRRRKTRNFGRLYILLSQLRLAKEWGAKRIYPLICFSSCIAALPCLPLKETSIESQYFLSADLMKGKSVRMFLQQ